MIDSSIQWPGAHERHLLRKSNNPLFNSPVYTSLDLERARLQDQNELAEFTVEVQLVVMQCLQLGAVSETEDVLLLKEQLDKLYERSCGLAGDLSREQDAIQSVITPIMGAIKKNAAADPKALQKLADEKSARELHIEFLNNKLVCDLLRPDSTIGETELIATLLSEPLDTMSPVLDFFENEHLSQLSLQGHNLLKSLSLPPDHAAHPRLLAIEQHLAQRKA